MTGNQYKKLIARYILAAYAERGVKVYEEVGVGTSIIGKQRRLDLLVLTPEGGALAVECKYQDSAGTVDEKIPYALQDLAAHGVPGVIAYAGSGFSDGVLHLLQSSERAAYCLPEEPEFKPVSRKTGQSIDSGTWQLDHAIAVAFHWWDLLVLGRQPLTVEALDTAAKETASKDMAAKDTAARDSATKDAPAKAPGPIDDEPLLLHSLRAR